MIGQLLDWLGSGVVVAALFGGLVWLLRTLVNHWLANDAEAYKAKLREASDQELERLRGEMKRAAFQYETRFSRLHEEMFKAIVEVYAPLHELYWSVRSYLAMFEMSDEPSKEQKLEATKAKAEEFKAL